MIKKNSNRVETTFVKRKTLVFWYLSALYFDIYKDQISLLVLYFTNVIVTVTNDDFFPLQ